MKSCRIIRICAILLLVGALLPVHQTASAAPLPTADIPAEAVYVPGEVVVVFAGELPAAVSFAHANALAGSMGAKVIRQYKNLALLSVDPGIDVTELINQVSASSQGFKVQPNYIHRLPAKGAQLGGKVYRAPDFSIQPINGSSFHLSWAELLSLRSKPNSKTVKGSPVFPNEVDTAWGWVKVGADIIWTTPASKAQVCLLDSGVDVGHPEFSGMMLAGYDFVNNDSIPNDDNGHGTHVAGIITAKAQNGAGTAIGVSNTKIVPVKVANAQGWGTTFSVVAGINYCANLASIKIINLSLGGPSPDALEYAALSAAIARGKLVVTPAGNESMSFVDNGGSWQPASFPAGWAIAKVDSSGEYMDTGADNALYKGLISVGAAVDDSLSTWVDKSGDRNIQPEELHLDCAANFSNYGNWVNLVAPGGNTLSTTPKSYPFYMNYFNAVPPSYGVMSGTSQAAAFVTGAASRVWGIFPLMNHFLVKDQLLKSGKPLTLVSDRGVNLANFDENAGFTNDSNYTIPYGIPFNPDEGQEPNTVMAPFCWPKIETAAPTYTLQEMSATRYLNVASAMGRIALWTTVLDGSSGIPAAGASVKVLTGTVQKGIGLVPAGLTRAQPDAVISNIPLPINAAYVPQSTNFTLQVSRSGNTNGFQTIAAVTTAAVADPGDWTQVSGRYYRDPMSRVSLLPAGLIQAVLDWNPPSDFDYSGAEPFPNLDVYLRLPKEVNATEGAVIGPPDSLVDFGAIPYLGAGTLLDPIKFGGDFSPYSLYHFDGGREVGAGENGSRIFSTTNEGISIASSFTQSTRPFLRPKYAGSYTFLVTANLPAFLNNTTPEIKPVVRLWAKGNLVQTYRLEDTPGCDVDHDWWEVFTFNGVVVSSSTAGRCGAETMLPYP